MKREKQEYAVISNVIDILCVLCAANRDTVIDKLTNYLWTEEEAIGIKHSAGRYSWSDKEKFHFDAPVKHVFHSVLQRANDESEYKSRCPVCKKGILLVGRDQKTLELLADDRCISCGQAFVYNDIQKLRDREKGKNDD